MAKTGARKFFICVDNRGYGVSLEKRKIYVALADDEAERHGQIRVIDESGEDYLYPNDLFIAIVLPQAVKRMVLAAA